MLLQIWSFFFFFKAEKYSIVCIYVYMYNVYIYNIFISFMILFIWAVILPLSFCESSWSFVNFAYIFREPVLNLIAIFYSF